MINNKNLSPEILEAIQYLHDNKVCPIQDYEPSKAVQIAIEFKLNKLIENEKGKEQPIDFCDCGSWIAGNSRCECGNCRVYWDSFSDNLNSVLIFPTQD